MLKVVCINGISYSGKDTFVDYMESILGRNKVARMSTVDPIKELYANFFGWDNKKTDKDRKNLNTLKNIWRETCKGPFIYSLSQMYSNSDKEYLFIMVREFEEMIEMKDLAINRGFKAYTLKIHREALSIPPVEQEFLDQHPSDYRYDFSFFNKTVDTFPDLPEMRDYIGMFLKLTM